MSENRSNSRRVIKVKMEGGTAGSGGTFDGNVTVVNTPDVNVVNTPDVNVASLPDLHIDSLPEIPLEGLYLSAWPTLNNSDKHRLLLNSAGFLLVEFPGMQYPWTTSSGLNVFATNQVLTNTYTPVGNALFIRSYNQFSITISATINDSRDVTAKILVSNDNVEFFETPGNEVTLWNVATGTKKIAFTFELGCFQYVRLHVMAGTVGATPGTITVKGTAAWR